MKDWTSDRSGPWWFWGGCLGYLLVINRTLPGAWETDPANHSGGWAFGIWAVGTLAVAFSGRPMACSLPLSVAALLIGAVGNLGSLNVLCQVALALGWTALCRYPSTWVPILLGAVGWMPAWGWGWRRLMGEDLDGARIPFVLGCLVTAGALIFSRKRSNANA